MLVDDLIAARALIDTPEKWMKGARPMGKRPKGGPISTVEATIEATNYVPMAAFPLVDALWAELPKRWRDSGRADRSINAYEVEAATTHADVLALFDRAIARARTADMNQGKET